MKILLISANTLKAPYPVYPIGLDHVAAALHDRHAVAIEDLNVLAGLEALVDRIQRFAPDLVGISLRNIDNTDTTDPVGFVGGYRRLMEAVRRATTATVVLGGSGFTLFPRRVLAALGADLGIVGEGERLDLLVDAIESGGDPAAVPGVVVPGTEPSVVPPPWEGSRIPLPATPGAHRDWYLTHGAMLNLQTKRGCPFRCIYCTYPLIEGRRLRRVAPDAAARTALALEAAGARYLYITDSSFNADIDHSLAVARAFRSAGVAIPWGAFFTPMTLPDGYFETLAAAGLKHVEFGTDTLSEAMLKTYAKPFTVDQAFASHEQAVGAGCKVAHYLLLGGPGETEATLAETLGRLASLRKTVLFLFCGMRVYPHTALFERSCRDGILDPGCDLLDPVYYRSPGIRPDVILERVRKNARGRVNWVVGGGGDAVADITQRMHAKGFAGPLWEHLIR